MRKGRMVDVSNALSAGPFTPERAGAVQNVDLLNLCFSGEFTKDEIYGKLVGGGGLTAYLGTNDAKAILSRIEKGDEEADRVLRAMIHQVAKYVGGMAAALDGEVDAIVLTGGLAHNEFIVEGLKKKVAFLGEVVVVPGEDELKALALGSLRVLRGEETAKTYPQTVEGGPESCTEAEGR
jgi:butyrate kinase